MGQQPCRASQSGLCFGPYTNWGGYSSTFRPGITDAVRYLLDVIGQPRINDFRFDWTRPSMTKLAFRRDWVSMREQSCQAT